MEAQATAARRRARHNLPAEVSSFVGRRHELAEVKRLLAATRLLTLAGPGGVGKSRLALRAAADMVRAFDDGVRLVELAAVDDPALLANAVADGLGIRDLSPRWLVTTLSEYLAERRLLLVIDNCEHLLDACAVLADALLRASPELRVLATSRQPLGIGGELVFPVPPLTLPAEGWVGAPDRLLQYEAVTLFRERATAVAPDFELTAATQPAVIELCHRLDGMPLAIELAAVRLRALTADQVLERLGDRFGLLTSGSRSALPRQQTLRATIAWSHDLLPPPMKVLFRRLAVFSGFDLEAAEAVGADGELAAGQVLDLLTGLLERSLVQREDRGGRPRYRLLETMREFALDQLRAAGEEWQVRRRHRDWMVGLAVAAVPHLQGERQTEWLDRLDREHGNLRRALDFSLRTPGESDAGLFLAAALWVYWQARNRIPEGRRWLAELLEVSPEPSPARAQGLMVGGRLAILQGDVETGESLLAASRDAARRLGAGEAEASATFGLSVAPYFRGDLDRAIEIAAAARVMFDHLGSRAIGAYLTRLYLGQYLCLRGDFAAGRAEIEASLALARLAGDRWSECDVLRSLGMCDWLTGQPVLATRQMRESLRLSAALGDEYNIALCLDALAMVAAASRPQHAARLLGAAAAAWDGAPPFLGIIWVALREGAATLARSALGEEAYRRERERGAGLTVEEATALGLDERSAPAASPAPLPAGQLSRREAEVAALLAEGMTNKEIGQRLFISERTVESHVEHILDKLGLGSRTQVAAWFGERRAGRS
ncbi:MAG TPA: LuxR C-terminal-related transcriptional regulator [Candidatus Dormibacteraeota bacterium]|nr:LuxR C-terminal-related transcriptional regulator [Candidatus Dormibacteraeota bacterium]